MVLGLIGMSGIGKTMWAKRLTESGFVCFHCDDLIAERLRAAGIAETITVDDVGRWMGFPWSDQYGQRETQYMRYESEVLHEIVRKLAREHTSNERFVVDMTGSAIYVEPGIRAAIQQAATIVYLAASPAHQTELLRSYQAKPRPVIWNGYYTPLPHETPEASLARCYGNLLEARSTLYAAFANIRLEAAVHQTPEMTVARFLEIITQ